MTPQLQCETLPDNKLLFNDTLYSIWDNSSSALSPHHDLDSVEVLSASFWIYLLVYVCLVLFAGVASGLTLGLLSLDCTTVTIIAEGSDSPEERRRARSLLPVIKKHHLLLVTLLLSNAIAVESMPIFLDKISNPLTSILVSVTAVLFFGEVIPQSVCSRYGTAIGYYSIPLVYLLMGLTFVISYPVSKLLDCLLGSEHGTYYKRSELGALVDILSDKNDSHNPEPLSGKERLIIKGALEMRTKVVRDINYTPMDEVFMINLHSSLDLQLIDQIKKKGWSRIPVYINKRSNVVGVIAVKHLIGYGPAEEIPVHKVFKLFGRPVVEVCEDDPVYDALNALERTGNRIAVISQSGHSASKVVSTDKQLGIVSLHDILEEVFQTEFFDIDNRNLNVSINFQKAVANLDDRSSISDTPILNFWSNDDDKHQIVPMETFDDTLQCNDIQLEHLRKNGDGNSNVSGRLKLFSNLRKPFSRKATVSHASEKSPQETSGTENEVSAPDLSRETFLDDDTHNLVSF